MGAGSRWAELGEPEREEEGLLRAPAPAHAGSGTDARKPPECLRVCGRVAVVCFVGAACVSVWSGIADAQALHAYSTLTALALQAVCVATLAPEVGLLSGTRASTVVAMALQ